MFELLREWPSFALVLLRVIWIESPFKHTSCFWLYFVELSQFVDLDCDEMMFLLFHSNWIFKCYILYRQMMKAQDVSCLGNCSNTFYFIFICSYDHCQRDFIDFLLFNSSRCSPIWKSNSWPNDCKLLLCLFALSLSLNECIIKLKEFSTLTLFYNSCF